MDAAFGYFGLTDPDWYTFLRAKQTCDEVNFWQPHGERNFRALKQGNPFFFKLRAPHKAIAGFGFFERFESMPAWLAWDCFGQLNGASDFPSLIARISKLRNEAPEPGLSGDFRIGCIMISAPVFFAQGDWVNAPADWAKTGIQQGKRYDVLTGEGARVLRECIERARGRPNWNVEPVTDSVSDPGARYGSPIAVRPRLGQGLFSLAVRDAYRGACAVTNEHSWPVLEAAHIKPYANGGEHRISNGLLLRRDLHRLYDKGYVTITPDHVFRVGDRLKREFNNGLYYYSLHDQKISVPDQQTWLPDKELLDWHSKTVFKG